MMTRISRSLIRQASKYSLYLPPLLRAAGSLEHAKQELRWIQNELPKHKWIDAITRRSNFEPLQYILGTQPFGSLDIICKPGVLIPRWETEEWCIKLTEILSKNYKQSQPLKILDACTGSGCIPLLLHSELSNRKRTAKVIGFDFSKRSIEIARENLLEYLKNHDANGITLDVADVFDPEVLQKLNIINIDIITSNPPYIPFADYKAPTKLNGVEKSVRLYEPRTALIGNLEFYQALIKNLVIPSQCKAFVFEVGYAEQVEFTSSILKKLDSNVNWRTGSFHDSAGNIRAVVGWKANTEFEFLEEFCDKDSYSLKEMNY